MSNNSSNIPSSTDPAKRGRRSFWQWLVEPPATITGADQRRQARLVSVILLTVTLAAITGPFIVTFALHDPIMARVLAGMSILFGIGYISSRTRRYRLAVPFLLIATSAWPILNFSLGKDYSAGGLLTSFVFDALVIVIAGTLTSFHTTFLLALANLLSLLLLPIFIPAVLFSNMTIPLVFNGLVSALILVLTSHRNLVEKDRLSEIAQINRSLETSNADLNARTRVLNDRTRGLNLAIEVGRSVSQVRALNVMLKDAAEIIRSRFDLYYAQVYLTNPSQTALVLQSGTGTVGVELVSRRHSLPLDTTSINGRAAVEKHSVVISDTAASSTFRPNPLLPDTRSEMAVPLLIGDRVVGVLDLQSQKAGALSLDVLPAFEALAGQLAIAIQNATLLAETEQARAEVEKQAARLTRANWRDYLDAIHQPEQIGFLFDQNKVVALAEVEDFQPPADGNALTAPISITGEVLGSLVVEMDKEKQSAQATELANIVARQVAQQIESLRLLDSSERYRAEAEEAARRLTREGWKTYTESTGESLSYLYDLREVCPLNGSGSDESATTVPLNIRGEMIGKLAVQGLNTDDKESMDLANAVAERLSAHIESLRQFEETQRGQVELDKRARQLAAVAEISSVSSRELDIDKMLHSVVHLTQRQFGLYHAHVFTFNENTAELKIAACGYKEGDEHEGTDGTAVIPLAQEQSLVAHSARTRQAVIVNNVRNEPGWLPNPLLPDTNSEMAVPLIIGDQLLGVLDVQSDILNAFSEEDANIYATLASQVSTALQNARSFAKSQQQADRESTLNIISQKIQSATTVEAVLQIAARELGHALGAPLTIAQLGMKDHSN